MIQKRGVRAPDGEAAFLREGPCSWAANENRAADRGSPAGPRCHLVEEPLPLTDVLPKTQRSARGRN